MLKRPIGQPFWFLEGLVPRLLLLDQPSGLSALSQVTNPGGLEPLPIMTGLMLFPCHTDNDYSAARWKSGGPEVDKIDPNSRPDQRYSPGP
jgi:hypothetical protein